MLWMIIVGALLIAVTWPVFALLKAPFWIAGVITAAIVLIVATVLIVRFVRARLRAAALERELLRQAERQANQVRPDRRPEILALLAQMKAALDILKRSKLGGGGKAALYALPWYVVIGPPAAGKTTALSKSGLGFITPQGASDAKVRGTAGTRNCDWWFSQNAILLDTAGRLATEDDDREEWMTFLATVRRFRSNRPLDGLVVAVSVEDLLTQSEEQLHELVGQLRARTDELMSRLEMVLPIYVLFTKVDLLGGFVEFFGDLTKQQRAQAWGASFSLDDERLQEPAQLVEAEFDTLVRVLHARMIERLAREPQPEVRARVLQFPLEFTPLREPVTRFIEELCRSNPYSETPFVRGFYFSSGTQTGRSMDRVIGNMARGFNLGMLAVPEGRRPEPQSFFVTELFSKVVFPDRHLAVRSLSRVRRSTRNQFLWGGAAVLAALVLITPAALSYVTNTKLVQATERDVREARGLERSGQAVAAANALDLLLERNVRLEEARNEFSVRALIGPYSAPRLHDSLRGLYLQRLRAMVEGPVQTQLVADVRGIADTVRNNPRNFQTAYQDVKLYVMLTQPVHLQPEYAIPRLTEVWARAFNSQSEADQQRLAAHAKRYIDSFVADKSSWAWKVDAAALSNAQGSLAALDYDELLYATLVEAAEGAPPIRPENIFVGAAAPYWTTRGDVEVPGMYTALGWEKIRKLLDEPDIRFELEPWVLGKAASERQDSRDVAAQRLRELYFKRYTARWSDFLGGLEVTPPENMEGAIEELRVLTESDGPYVRLFRTVAENVRLDIGTVSDLEKLLAKGMAKGQKKLQDKLKRVGLGADAGDAGAPPERAVSSVERHFDPLLRFIGGVGKKADAAPTGLSQYLTHLSTLEGALTQLAESQQASGNEFGAELSRTAVAVQHQLNGMDRRMRMVVEPLLMNPIRGSRAGVVRADLAQLTGDWKSEVWEVYRTKIKPRYPFSDVPAEVTLPEFADFFRPQTGLFWTFFKKAFEARLERSGSSYVPKPSADSMPFRADFLTCLNVAQQITDAVFGNGQEPSVKFAVRVHSVSARISETTLIVDGQAIRYRNEPERWITTTWPGKGDPRGGTLQVKGAGFQDEIPRMGDFGLFRLLADGGVAPTGTMAGGVPVLLAKWALSRGNEPPVSIDFKPAKTVHPFAANFFRRFNCPSEVTVGAAAAARQP
ncbi:MAG: type VI secretion system membrane subunit TssM [Polyangiaceae bacterium]|nr:type VI secretion system membrane subunit TssM [Polyangiaceae bacterium]